MYTVIVVTHLGAVNMNVLPKLLQWGKKVLPFFAPYHIRILLKHTPIRKKCRKYLSSFRKTACFLCVSLHEQYLAAYVAEVG